MKMDDFFVWTKKSSKKPPNRCYVPPLTSARPHLSAELTCGFKQQPSSARTVRTHRVEWRRCACVRDSDYDLAKVLVVNEVKLFERKSYGHLCAFV